MCLFRGVINILSVLDRLIASGRPDEQLILNSRFSFLIKSLINKNSKFVRIESFRKRFEVNKLSVSLTKQLQVSGLTVQQTVPLSLLY